MKCPKCGSGDQFSGTTFFDEGGFSYEYGCEDCDHYAESELNHDWTDAVKEARERFLNA